MSHLLLHNPRNMDSSVGHHSRDASQPQKPSAVSPAPFQDDSVIDCQGSLASCYLPLLKSLRPGYRNICHAPSPAGHWNQAVRNQGHSPDSGDILWVLLAKSSSYSMPKFSTPPLLKADLTKVFQAGGGGAEEKKVLDICSPHGILFHDPPALR